MTLVSEWWLKQAQVLTKIDHYNLISLSESHPLNSDSYSSMKLFMVSHWQTQFGSQTPSPLVPFHRVPSMVFRMPLAQQVFNKCRYTFHPRLQAFQEKRALMLLLLSKNPGNMCMVTNTDPGVTLYVFPSSFSVKCEKAPTSWDWCEDCKLVHAKCCVNMEVLASSSPGKHAACNALGKLMEWVKCDTRFMPGKICKAL